MNATFSAREHIDSASAKPPLRLTPTSILDRFQHSPASTASQTPEHSAFQPSPQTRDSADVLGVSIARVSGGRLPPAGKPSALPANFSSCTSRPWWHTDGHTAAEPAEAPRYRDQKQAHQGTAIGMRNSSSSLQCSDNPHHRGPSLDADCFSPHELPKPLPQQQSTVGVKGSLSSNRPAECSKAAKDVFNSMIDRFKFGSKPITCTAQPADEAVSSRYAICVWV
jgi:hypothetical protein